MRPSAGGRYGNTSAFGNVGNPILDIEKNDNRSFENRLQGNVGLNLKPVEGLTLRSAINVDLTFNNRRIYDYQYLNDEVTFLKAGGNQRNNRSTLNVSQVNSTRYLWENTATYQRLFADKHELTLLAGTVVEEGKANSAVGRAQQRARRPQPVVPEHRRPEYVGERRPGAGPRPPPLVPGPHQLRLRRQATCSPPTCATMAPRSSTPTSAGACSRRWAWAGSCTEEGFLKDQNVLNFLKLRASYGQLGNDQIPTPTPTS